MIAIRQEQPLGEDPAIVFISPERVGRAIERLQAVRDDIIGGREDAGDDDEPAR